ncbi:MAG TPA: FMN-binding negative transcriptional regulator [Ideonella sp.]|uniref:FMN-binding negative transcriptional regulator n=1 Tax=Ideonella sp. TaxID=1929293 RepID=UPI002E367EDB|nr:FMN-binding negative transcriptional regulator [Ideonella sp.]HEX5685431.1 FMN-binding negative transcriptional regulator [Ideonella sp.]
MHLPQFANNDPQAWQALITAHPLGTWFSAHDGALRADHVPFLFDPQRGPHGALLAHVSRANQVWRNPGQGLVVFNGPQAYVSPSWYPSKHAHGKAVPTWNYAVVHVHGQARAIEGRDEVLALVERLTTAHEQGQAVPWQVSDAPATYIDQLLRAIVGIEITVDKIEGRWKMSQNRSEADRLGVTAGLQQIGSEEARAVAALVQPPVMSAK